MSTPLDTLEKLPVVTQHFTASKGNGSSTLTAESGVQPFSLSVTNKHEWLASERDAPPHCEHDELPASREKEWFIPDSPQHIALRRIVLDKWFLQTIKYYVNVRLVCHNGNLH